MRDVLPKLAELRRTVARDSGESQKNIWKRSTVFLLFALLSVVRNCAGCFFNLFLGVRKFPTTLGSSGISLQWNRISLLRSHISLLSNQNSLLRNRVPVLRLLLGLPSLSLLLLPLLIQAQFLNNTIWLVGDPPQTKENMCFHMYLILRD